MKLQKFEILSAKEDQSLHVERVDMLINIDHIISVKPIRIIVSDNILDGYWIRISNGKKYKATKVPDSIIKALEEELIDPNFSDSTDNFDDLDLH